MNPPSAARLTSDDTTGATAAPPASGARRVPSAALFGREREVVILHRGQEYRLRITKADKLILTK